MTNNNRPKIALVLGGGGSRGLAHIGVLKVLEREGIPIDMIIGTSMGGIIGALYAMGYNPAEIGQGINRLQQNSLISVTKLTIRARQRWVRDFLVEIFGDKTFADLHLPVTLMAVDMVHGQEICMREGALVPALLASSAVPGAFPPVDYMGSELNDGGVIDSLATWPAFEQGAERVIAVDVYPALEKENPWTDPVTAIMGLASPGALFGNSGDSSKIPTLWASMWRATRVMTWYVHQKRLEDHPPDILLRPDVDGHASLDFRDIDTPIQAGVEEAERHIDALRALLDEDATTREAKTR